MAGKSLSLSFAAPRPFFSSTYHRVCAHSVYAPRAPLFPFPFPRSRGRPRARSPSLFLSLLSLPSTSPAPPTLPRAALAQSLTDSRTYPPSLPPGAAPALASFLPRCVRGTEKQVHRERTEEQRRRATRSPVFADVRHSATGCTATTLGDPPTQPPIRHPRAARSQYETPGPSIHPHPSSGERRDHREHLEGVRMHRLEMPRVPRASRAPTPKCSPTPCP
jgi:hypothetical protein